jgi:hypothetical protein
VDHLVFALGQSALTSSASKFAKRAAEEEIENDEENQDEDDSIHSGMKRRAPQSYETVGSLSTEPSWLCAQNNQSVAWPAIAPTAYSAPVFQA